MDEEIRPQFVVDDALIDQLEHGPLHRFAEYATLATVIPGSGAGVYTIWDDAGGLVYAGVAGRNPSGAGFASRLRSHASGRRSGDQFCVYVADHYVLPELSRDPDPTTTTTTTTSPPPTVPPPRAGACTAKLLNVALLRQAQARSLRLRVSTACRANATMRLLRGKSTVVTRAYSLRQGRSSLRLGLPRGLKRGWYVIAARFVPVGGKAVVIRRPWRFTP